MTEHDDAAVTALAEKLVLAMPGFQRWLHYSGPMSHDEADARVRAVETDSFVAANALLAAIQSDPAARAALLAALVPEPDLECLECGGRIAYVVGRAAPDPAPTEPPYFAGGEPLSSSSSGIDRDTLAGIGRAKSAPTEPLDVALRQSIEALPRHTSPDGEETWVEWAALRDVLGAMPDCEMQHFVGQTSCCLCLMGHPIHPDDMDPPDAALSASPAPTLDVAALRDAVDVALFDAEIGDTHPGCRTKWRRIAMAAFDRFVGEATHD